MEEQNAKEKEVGGMFYQKNVLTLSEVARYIGLSKSAIYKRTCRGEIPCYKPTGKKLYFDRLEVENWLKRNPIKTAEAIEQEAATYVVVGRQKGGMK